MKRNLITLTIGAFICTLCSCALVTTPVKVAGKVATTTVGVAGKAAGAGINAVTGNKD